MQKFLILIFLLLIPSTILLAQPEGAVKEVIDGKEYYIHTVKKGETLYGISKQYKVKPDVIIVSNPEAKDGIKPDDKLKIPVPGSSVTTNSTVKPVDQNYIIHKVEKGETVYGISKKYGITEEQLFSLNPEAKVGLSIGMELKIPKKADITKKELPVVNDKPAPPIPSGDIVLVEHTVQKNETFYSLSKKYQVSDDSIKSYNNGLTEGLKKDQTLVIPVKKSLAESSGWKWYPDLRTLNEKKEEKQEIVKNETGIFNVGLFLPFYLDRNQQVMENSSKSELFEPTRQSLDFYHGVMLAIDSLSKYGLNVNLYVNDTNRDTSRIANFVKSEEFKKLDLIIGPTDLVELVTSAAKENKIPLVCPFAYTNKILFDNIYVSKVVTSASVVIDAASSFIASNYTNENIILIDGKGKKDENAVDAYHKKLNSELKAKGSGDSVKLVKVETLASKTWIEKLKKDKVNVLVVPSNDLSFVSSFISNLNNLSIKPQYKDYKFVVMGTDDWLRYDDIDAYYKVRFNVHIPSPVYISYTDTVSSVPFIKAFREKYNTDPDKYAMMGFDIAWFYLSGYLKHGKEFSLRLDEFEGEGVNTGFHFRRLNENSGFLNTNVYILKYENYQLIKLN